MWTDCHIRTWPRNEHPIVHQVMVNRALIMAPAFYNFILFFYIIHCCIGFGLRLQTCTYIVKACYQRHATSSFLCTQRPSCHSCSGSIPKVNKLTRSSEWIVNWLCSPRGHREWSVLFGQLSWGEMSGLHHPTRGGWQTDRQTDGRTDRPKWHSVSGKQYNLVTHKRPDWNKDRSVVHCWEHW